MKKMSHIVWMKYVCKLMAGISSLGVIFPMYKVAAYDTEFGDVRPVYFVSDEGIDRYRQKENPKETGDLVWGSYYINVYESVHYGYGSSVSSSGTVDSESLKNLIDENRPTGSDYFLFEYSAQSLYETAIGRESSSTSFGGTAVGGKSSSNYYSTSLGVFSHALGNYATVIGSQSYVSDKTKFAVAVGYNASSRSDQAIAIGHNAYSGVSDGIAIGSESVANTAVETTTINGKEVTIRTVSFGHQSGDSYLSRIATNSDSFSENSYNSTTLSRLTNIADGKADTDAATVGQLKEFGISAQTVSMANVTVDDKNQTNVIRNDNGDILATFEKGTVSSGNTGFVTGGDVWNAIAKYAQSLDFSNTSGSAGDATVNAASNNGAANGKGVDSSETSNTSLASNVIYSNDGTPIATFSQMKEVSSTDTGFVSGSDLYNETRKGIAESNATKYHISADKTAAENMLALDSYIGSVEEGSPDNTDGSKNTYKAISSSNTVSQNLQSLDTAVYTLDNKMDGLIKQDGDTIHIGGGETSQNVNVINIAKTDGTGRVLSGIADGVGDTDAVNMRQYNALANRYGDIESRLTSDIRSVGAGAAALAALHPGTYDPTDKMSFAVGFGHYKDANAGALGAFYRPNADTLISVGGTVGNGNPMFNVGFSFKLGERGVSDRTYGGMMDVSPKFDAQDKKIIALEKTIDLQSKKIATLESDKVMQDKKIAALEADNQRIKAQMAEILKKVELSDIVKKTAAAH